MSKKFTIEYVKQFLLEKNIDKIDWNILSENPNAIPILEKHFDKICWCNFLKNPNFIDQKS